MLPMTVGMAIFGPIGGKLSDKHGSKGIATIGLVMSASAIFMLTTISAYFVYTEMAVLLFVFGAGYGMFNAPNASALMSSVPPEDRGGLWNVFNFEKRRINRKHGNFLYDTHSGNDGGASPYTIYRTHWCGC